MDSNSPLQPLPRIDPGSFPELVQTPIQGLGVLLVEAAVEFVERGLVLAEEALVEKLAAGRPSADENLFFFFVFVRKIRRASGSCFDCARREKERELGAYGVAGVVESDKLLLIARGDLDVLKGSMQRLNNKVKEAVRYSRSRRM